MVQIIVDTQKDSVAVMNRVVALLQEEIAKQNGFPMQQTTSSQEPTSTNSFTSLFDETPSSSVPTSTPAQSSPQSSSSVSANPFDMFSNGLPNSSGVSSSQQSSHVSMPDFSQEPSYPQQTQSYQAEQSDTSALSDIDNLFTGKRAEPVDFEGSSRFAEYNAQKTREEPKKPQGLLHDLDTY